MKKAVFNWSGGKDSALALQKVLEEKEFEVIALLTTMNEETAKSSMHSIPLEILERQADSIGIPLYAVTSSTMLKNYEEKIQEAVKHFKEQGVKHFIFGDIFLSDVKIIRGCFKKFQHHFRRTVYQLKAIRDRLCKKL